MGRDDAVVENVVTKRDVSPEVAVNAEHLRSACQREQERGNGEYGGYGWKRSVAHGFMV